MWRKCHVGRLGRVWVLTRVRLNPDRPCFPTTNRTWPYATGQRRGRSIPYSGADAHAESFPRQFCKTTPRPVFHDQAAAAGNARKPRVTRATRFLDARAGCVPTAPLPERRSWPPCAVRCRTWAGAVERAIDGIMPDGNCVLDPGNRSPVPASSRLERARNRRSGPRSDYNRTVCVN